MEHGTAGDTTGPGHGNLLVLLAACRGLGACQQSLPVYPEPLLSLTVRFIASFTVLVSPETTRPTCRTCTPSRVVVVVSHSTPFLGVSQALGGPRVRNTSNHMCVSRLPHV